MSAKAKTVPVSTVPFWKKYTGLLLAGFAFLLFANTLGHDYNMDDELVTRKHKYTSKGLQAIGDIFTNPYYSDDMGYAYGYRPMVHLSFAIEHQFFGESAATGHFFNVLLFALLVMLLFKLIYLWTGEKGFPIAIIGAVLFAVHPVHTEVVASLKNRDEILALLFGLLAGISATHAVRKNTILPFVLSAVWFVCALLSKKSMYPLVFIFPVALVLFEKSSLKKLLILSCIWVIPGSWIVADTPDVKFILLLVFPPVFSVFIWWLNKSLKAGENTRKALFEDTWILPIFCALTSLAALAFAYRSMNMYVYAVSFLPALFLLFVRPSVGLWFLTLFTGLAGWLLQSNQLALASVFIGFYQCFVSGVPTKKEWMKWSGVAVVAFLFWLKYHLVGDFIFIAVVGLVFWVYQWKKGWGILFSFIVAAVTAFFSEDFGVMQLSFLWLGFSGLVTIKFSVPGFFRIRAGVFAALGIVFMILFQRSLANPEVKTEQQPVFNKEIRVSALQEGRKLEYAENTLMVPHSTGEKLGTGAVILGEYLKLMVFPYELSFYYGYARVKTEGLTNPFVWISLLIHLGLIALAIWQIRKHPLLSLGIFWYLISILLFSNWVELVAGMMGERLAFTASAGFCIMVASLFHWLKPDFSLKNLKIPEVLFLILVLAFGMRTLLRNIDWKNSLTLMGNDIEHLDNSAHAHNLYAMNLMASSFDNKKKWTPQQQLAMRQMAASHFDKALQIWPDFFNAAYDKGRVGLVIGDMDLAIAGFEKAVTLDNDFMDPYYQLSEIYITRGMFPQFLVNARRIFENEDERFEKYSLMARAQFLNNHADSAKIYLRQGINLYPKVPDLYQNMVEVFKAEGNTDSAGVYLQRIGR